MNIFPILSVSVRFPHGPTKGSSGLLFKANRPVPAATDIPADVCEEIRNHRNLSEPFKEMFDAEKFKVERVLNRLMRTVLVPSEQLRLLAQKGVYFMGDSAHAEPILGGDGANDTIRDGMGLAKCIAKEGPESISAWYKETYSLWEAGVRESEARLCELHTVQPSTAL